MLDENETAVTEAEASVPQRQSEKDNADRHIRYINEQYQNTIDWAAEFESADSDTKKMILTKLIERIDVDRNDHLSIIFFIAKEEFGQIVESTNTNATIMQAENVIGITHKKASA